jgi:chromosome segregation ATPase
MNCPNKSSISGIVLEKHILYELNSIIEQYCQTDEIQLTDSHSEQLRELERRLASLESRQKTAKERLVKAYKDKLDGVVSDDEYALFRESLSADEEKFKEQAAEVTKHITDCRKQQQNAEGQKALITKYTHLDSLDRSLADGGEGSVTALLRLFCFGKTGQ